MKSFKSLTAEENRELLKFPAYISLLVANRSNEIDDVEKKSAIKFAHTKTFSCDPLLKEFYKNADEVFEVNLEQLDKELPKELSDREASIKKELVNLQKIVSKLGKEYVSVMQRSMKSFSEHVSKAHNNLLVDIVIPLSIPGLTE